MSRWATLLSSAPKLTGVLVFLDITLYTLPAIRAPTIRTKKMETKDVGRVDSMEAAILRQERYESKVEVGSSSGLTLQR